MDRLSYLVDREEDMKTFVDSLTIYEDSLRKLKEIGIRVVPGE